MDIDGLLSTLDYQDSPAFIKDTQLDDYPAYSFIFSRAKRDCDLRGVYTLREKLGGESSSRSLIPLVYVCEAANDQDAREIHRLVWNQNIAPFLFVFTPRSIRLYLGFKFNAEIHFRKGDQAILTAEKSPDDVLGKFGAFKAESIDNGEIWPTWGDRIDPQDRVDWTLLNNLNELSSLLRTDKLSPSIAHSLIGKYVYLHYLRDRGILSNDKLRKWDIDPDSVFGRKATKKGLRQVSRELKKWLNGSIFPVPLEGENAPSVDHIQEVASVFKGDDPDSGQMHLDFKAYDFAHIPIETLSVVYQQFLHAEGTGRRSGAYYTPLHLVNFVLDELDAKKPLEEGMKVLDAACGSGAFLVQCYRRLIERKLRSEPRAHLQPKQLRELLKDHIYGMDIDEEACGITELSLIITLLDYVEPPDLKKLGYHTFLLPNLRNENIFHCKKGFFAPNQDWEKKKPKKGFDWIVGNPPWKNIKTAKLEKGEKAALDWISKNEKSFPVSYNQIAEGFAWEVTRYLSKEGVIGLLMPTTTLVKTRGESFRREFFEKMRVWCVVNFSNLRRVLFEGPIGPASAFFYSHPKPDSSQSSETILTYAPFAINQLTSRSAEEDKVTWSITVNASEIREIPVADAKTGSQTPWKIAMWGSGRDKHLLTSLDARFPSLTEFAKKHQLEIREGMQLRKLESPKQLDYDLEENEDDPESLLEKLEPCPQIVRKKNLVMKKLKGWGKIFRIPDEALESVDKSLRYARKGRAEKALKVCKPPHIIIDVSRKFAVFSDKFFVVPPRQIAIASTPSKNNLMKALALFLTSEFAYYHQFLLTVLGIERDTPRKADLERIPIPLDELTPEEIAEWAELHDKLTKVPLQESEDKQESLFDAAFSYSGIPKKDLLKSLNSLVYDVLGLKQSERWLIHDLLHVRKNLNEGKIARDALSSADKKEMAGYAGILKSELDHFLGDQTGGTHSVEISYTKTEAIVRILISQSRPKDPVKVVELDGRKRSLFRDLQARLLEGRGQWLYFNRSLRVYDGQTTFILKPRERLHWLKSQALADADEHIADMLAASAEDKF